MCNARVQVPDRHCAQALTALLHCINAAEDELADHETRISGLEGAGSTYAPGTATYITQTPSAALTNEQALSLLPGIGILKVASLVTGAISIATAGVDYSIPGHTHVATDITDFTEAAQDVIGGSLTDSSEIDFSYNDGAGTNTASLINNSIVAARLHATQTDIFFGRDTAAAGAGEEITMSFARTMLSLVIGTNVQAWDATLDAFAAYNTNGLITQTAADTFTGRTLTAPAAGFTITNPAGIAGNPTFVLADDLAGLEAMSSTGLVARTGTGTYSQRTLTAGAGGSIVISNGSGVSGNPLFVRGALTGNVTCSEDGTATTMNTTAITDRTEDTTPDTDADFILTYDANVVALKKVLLKNAVVANQKLATITFIIDGGGSVITTGIKGDLEIPFACTITTWTLVADQSGSIAVDIWKCTYSQFDNSTHPVVGDTLVGAEKPTITTAHKGQDTSLNSGNGWAVSAGDVIRFNVDSVTSIKRATLSLKVVKT